MKIEGLENNLMHQKYMEDEHNRLSRRLEEIKHRKPLFTTSVNIPTLPIIQSSRVARINHSRQL